jgi:type VI secretion system protein ImpB
MASESVFDKKGRTRAPRVHITYEVEKNGAMVQKELPFVVGVLADLSGKPKQALPKLKNRSFAEVDRDNFDSVLKSMTPRVAMKVENTLAGDGSELSVELGFDKMADFEPEQVARQVKPLNDLLEARNKLKDLLNRSEGNDRLEELLDAIISKDDVRDKLASLSGDTASEPEQQGGSEPEEASGSEEGDSEEPPAEGSE